MPNLASWHPVVVHFAIVLCTVGVLFRWLSLTGKAPFAGPTAAALLLAGTLAAVIAVHSGTDAHGPVERVPGARQAVQEHEDAGNWARNVFLVIAALEIGALIVARRSPRVTKGLTLASALVGLAGVGAIYKAGDRGGDLVYSYAGGVGLRSGDTADVSRLLLAGLYHSAQQARARHDSTGAAELIAEMARRFPADTTVRLLAIESLVQDKHDAKAALAALATFPTPDSTARFLAFRIAFLRADAYVMAGRPDSARTALQALDRRFPNNPRVQDRLAKLK